MGFVEEPEKGKERKSLHFQGGFVISRRKKENGRTLVGEKEKGFSDSQKVMIYF